MIYLPWHLLFHMRNMKHYIGSIFLNQTRLSKSGSFWNIFQMSHFWCWWLWHFLWHSCHEWNEWCDYFERCHLNIVAVLNINKVGPSFSSGVTVATPTSLEFPSLSPGRKGLSTQGKNWTTPCNKLSRAGFVKCWRNLYFLWDPLTFCFLSSVLQLPWPW